ncbi:MAG TPA: primary-amine oxidase [Acidimicrobiales bacterium]|nr:primary-amine oxidase [Acidimicrobiales bacterium]
MEEGTTVAVRGPDEAPAAHPLDPLTSAEIATACAIVTEGRGLVGDVRFPWVTLHEPPKDVVAGHRPGDHIDRQAEVAVSERMTGAVHEAVVSITRSTVLSWRSVPGAVTPLLVDELVFAFQAVKADARWQEAMRRRGVTDFELVQVDPWPAGNFGIASEAGRRLVRCVSYVRTHAADNGYARPVEGLVAVVDLATAEVIELVDREVVPVPEAAGNYDPASVGEQRSGLRPLVITQPEGPSFEVEGSEIRWQRWRLRVSVHPIEGVVLHTVGYEDGGRVRPILHRASVAEMVVPYGDTATNHWWKNAFDVGEWGLGKMMQSLTLGCDCLGEIRYLDAVVSDDRGGARTISNAVCLHEEDYGILWKHVDLWSGASEVRRSRRMVISFIATVGNYEYGFYWYLYLDGTIQLEVKLTGIIQTSAREPGVLPACGEVVGPELYAPNHQHLLCARLDFDVDGRSNSVYELDAVSLPAGRDNPEGTAFGSRATLLTSEAEAQRMIDPLAARCWKVVNPSSLNGLGQPVGYKLVPGQSTCLLASPSSSVGRRAAFASKSLWVTPFDPGERRPAGDYPNQSSGGDGLPAWTAADRPLVDTDVVLWHTFGLTHVPRPEDWPVTPVDYAGFVLKPAGFFDRNPALDVPPTTNGHCSNA